MLFAMSLALCAYSALTVTSNMWDDLKNPYYNADSLRLDLIVFDRPGLSYEYDTMIFVATPDGRVYQAQDSGCSCPTPFESYEGKDMEEVVSKMDRIGNAEDAVQQLRSWGKTYDGTKFMHQDDFDSLRRWVEQYIKE